MALFSHIYPLYFTFRATTSMIQNNIFMIFFQITFFKDLKPHTSMMYVFFFISSSISCYCEKSDKKVLTKTLNACCLLFMIDGCNDL